MLPREIEERPPGPRPSDSRRVEARVWYRDAIVSLACIAICLTLGKGFARLFGPFAGLFFVLVTGGAGWQFGKAAWRGLMGDRGQV